MKLRPFSLITLGPTFRIQFSQVLIALFRNFNPFLFLLSPLNNLLPSTNPLLLQRLKNMFFKLVPTKLLDLMAFLLFSSTNIGALSNLKLSCTVLTFFHFGYLFKPLNQTFITLIPKIPFLEEVSHFRPISLCNVVYKVIFKVLVNRLKPLMDSPYQNAFIKWRNIYDNILISHEIIDTLRRENGRKTSFGVLKIDMSKAYDRVNWTFLKAVLTVMKFEDK